MKDGEKVAKLRQLKGIKQESLAFDLSISQSELSRLENLDVIEKEILSQIADALGVSQEFLEKFDLDSALYNISNKIENSTISENSNGISQIFNPLDKVVELYERLLQSEREKIEILKNK
ncbi:transcriptional regulator with sigma factor-related N-terminal domain [Belliella baltica DSM 15883]|uniref:Transcriptional regulator with sigma factor-related N-terminal domain n=1 Tax=Belliella baltica (strain DSM 15883 / CIP 108006 / LMG 21964 / BA134) TaxID=866536 RepID=I3Z1X3_BELBD|nr:helix-turn-helix transcriptional regulator [Belliella baltica]AFL83241.1 transcriptional regulator with sigma factor-related N-terminal domain [Belliella baltica DSM 15883]